MSAPAVVVVVVFVLELEGFLEAGGGGVPPLYKLVEDAEEWRSAKLCTEELREEVAEAAFAFRSATVCAVEGEGVSRVYKRRNKKRRCTGWHVDGGRMWWVGG